ncbi:hypothetical protein ACFQRK_23380 [Parapedobacter sp. GCM10030251]|uniref:hypothetical protein n=1 Tax=Parapedobacter sp. GCM10030251 TaxID=3273419 RepID=UPI0036136661
MHVLLGKDGSYYELLKELKKNVPEFVSVFDEEDGVYPILGEFGRFIIENIDNEVIAKKSFRFINNAIGFGRNETEKAIVLQLFHPIYNNNSLIIESFKYLEGKSLQVFEEFRVKYDGIDKGSAIY